MDLKLINHKLSSTGVEEICRWAASEFSGKIILASSFGAEDVVLIDVMHRLSLPIPIFTLDTGRLNEETYQVMDAVRRKYGVAIQAFFPEKAAVERLEKEKGFYSFRESVENRKECCAVRKVEPLNRALRGFTAWMTGLRKAQSVTRAHLPIVEHDESRPGLYKINPLAEWSEKNVWDYIKERGVPYNKLHDAGFPSIGCEPCTRAVKAGEDVRAGRWWWESAEHKECGLHVNRKKE